MTKQCVKIFMKADSVNESVLPPSLPSFLPRQMAKSWISLLFFQFALSFYHFRKMGKERKRLTYGCLPSILAFPMSILGIHGELLSILQVFHIPLLYKSKKSRFCERLFQKFYEILIFQYFSGLSPSSFLRKEPVLRDCLSALSSFSAVGEESWYMSIVSPTRESWSVAKDYCHGTINSIRRFLHSAALSLKQQRSRTVHIGKAKFLREVVKMRGLCNINVWRRKSGYSPWKDSISPSVMYIANIPAGMQLWQIGKLWKPCIQVPDFPPRFPGAQGRRNEFCRFVKSFTTNQKHGLPSFAA